MPYRVEQIAAIFDLSVDTIRYYQKLGLLSPPDRQGRIAVYDETHREQLAEIKTLSDQGFKLAQISRLMSSGEDPLLHALRGDEPQELMDRAELGVRAGLDADLVALAIDAGLVRSHTGTTDLFGQDAVEMLGAAAVILESGLPLDALIAIAVEHAAHVEVVIDDAIDLFTKFVPTDQPDNGAATIARLVPAVSELVAQHFRHTLVDRASRRLAGSSTAEMLP